MEYYNGILCISGKDLIISDDNPNGLMSLSMYRKLAYTKKIITILRRGCNETPALIEFASLPEKYKQLVKEKGLLKEKGLADDLSNRKGLNEIIGKLEALEADIADLRKCIINNMM